MKPSMAAIAGRRPVVICSRSIRLWRDQNRGVFFHSFVYLSTNRPAVRHRSAGQGGRRTRVREWPPNSVQGKIAAFFSTARFKIVLAIMCREASPRCTAIDRLRCLGMRCQRRWPHSALYPEVLSRIVRPLLNLAVIRRVIGLLY